MLALAANAAPIVLGADAGGSAQPALVAIGPDREIAVENGRIRAWDPSGNPVGDAPLDVVPQWVALAGSSVVIGAADKVVLYDAQTLAKKGQTGIVSPRAAAMGPDGVFVAGASGIHVLDSNAKIRYVFGPQGQDALMVRDRVAASCAGDQVLVWDTQTGGISAAVSIRGAALDAGLPACAGILSDATVANLVVGTQDRGLLFVDVAGGTVSVADRAPVFGVFALAGGYTVRYADRAELITEAGAQSVTLSNGRQAAFAADGRAIADRGNKEGVVGLDRNGAIAWKPRSGHAGKVTDVAWTADGLFTAGDDGRILRWDAATLAPGEVITVSEPIRGFDVAGSRVAVATATHIELRAGLTTMWTAEGTWSDVDLTADGSRMAAGAASGRVVVIDADAGTLLSEVTETAPVLRVAYDDDAQKLGVLVENDRQARLMVRDPVRGLTVMVAGLVSQIPGTHALVALAWTPEDTVWTATSQGGLDHWLPRPNPARYGLHARATGESAAVTDVAWSGGRLLSAGADGSIEVHQVATNTVLGRIEFSSQPMKIAVSPDGKRVAAVLADGSACVEDLPALVAPTP